MSEQETWTSSVVGPPCGSYLVRAMPCHRRGGDSVPIAIEFEIHEIAGEDEDGTPVYSTGSEFNETTEPTVPIVRGFVKWDGCSHFTFGQTEGDKAEGYVHLCGPESILAFGEAVREVQRLALALMPEHAEYLTPREAKP